MNHYSKLFKKITTKISQAPYSQKFDVNYSLLEIN